MPSVGHAHGPDQGYLLQEAFRAPQAGSSSLRHAPTAPRLPLSPPQHTICLPITLPHCEPVEAGSGAHPSMPPPDPISSKKLSGTVQGTKHQPKGSSSGPRLAALSLAGIWLAQLALRKSANPLPAPPLGVRTLLGALEKSLSSCVPGSAAAFTASPRDASPSSAAWWRGIRCRDGGPLSAQRQDLSQFGEVRGPGALDHH